MKDNYSWLDEAFDKYLGSNDVVGSADLIPENKQLKQTIISQIEIEKLRARIDEAKKANKPAYLDVEGMEYFIDRINQLQEKLKELETKGKE